MCSLYIQRERKREREIKKERKKEREILNAFVYNFMQNINAHNNEGDFSHINKCTTLIRNIEECFAVSVCACVRACVCVCARVCVCVCVHQFGLPACHRSDTIHVCSTHR